jgi:RNA polymerase-binding transcription factor
MHRARAGPFGPSRRICDPTPAYDFAMTAPDLSAVRTALEAERDRLRLRLAEGIVAPGQMTYGSQAAAASQVFEQQRDLALRDHNAQHLEHVESALARLEDGTFGACLRCGRPIAPERLEALPWAAFCIDCQRIVGRGG